MNTELNGPQLPVLCTAPKTDTSFPLLPLTPIGRMEAATKEKLTISREDFLILTFGSFPTKRLSYHQLMRPIHTNSLLVGVS